MATQEIIQQQRTAIKQYLKDNTPKSTILKELGISCATYRRRVRELAKVGWSPEHDMTKTVPEGFYIKGTSTLYDEDGKTKLQWVKSNIDLQRQHELVLEAIETLIWDIPTRVPVAAPTTVLTDQLANLYTFTDYHLGMLAWHKEGGNDWDISIAKQTLRTVWTDMIDRSPKADTAIINQLGDWFHWDSMDSVTPASGHQLDADSRPAKMIEAGIDCLDFLVQEALLTHNKVILVCAQGNHDTFSAIWLRKLIGKLYANEPRLSILDSELPYYAMPWGELFLGFHHGHKTKFDKLPSLFMDQYRNMYGSTTKSFLHMGHYHHKEIKEVGTSVIEMHRTLAARDAYTSYGGWISDRSAEVITYHKTKGEYSRITVYP